MKCLCAHPRHPGSRCPVTACGCESYRPTAMPVTDPVRLFWPEGTEEEAG